MYKQTYPLLRGKMKELGMDCNDIGRLIGLKGASISKRLTGGQDWRLMEAYAVLDAFGEPYEKLHLYFPPGGKQEKTTTIRQQKARIIYRIATREEGIS